MSDENTPASEKGTVSVRITKEGIVARHIPTALVMALVAALNGGTCTAAGRIEAKVDDLATRVARLEGAFTGRVASHGTEGAGGTGAFPGD